MTPVVWAEAKLQGAPDRVLSVGLIAVAVVLVLVALFARPVVKPLVLAWVLAP